MMKNQNEYKGFAIETNAEELTDGSGWSESYIIKNNNFEGTWFGSDRTFQTRDEANAASLSAAKHKIDRSERKSGRGPDSNAVVRSDALSATWSEEENLRPAIQGDTDQLTGDGALHYTKDYRRQRLDELDGEPE